MQQIEFYMGDLYSWSLMTKSNQDYYFLLHMGEGVSWPALSQLYTINQTPGVRETKWNKNYREQCCMQ